VDEAVAGLNRAAGFTFASAMGVDNRTDPTQSIQGGAKYLSQLQHEFAQVPASDRVWFTLAAYNMGPQAIKDIQQILQKRGVDGNNWAAVYQYLKVNSQAIAVTCSA
jgi:membrane-bound lytic murein transglycosylase MltF